YPGIHVPLITSSLYNEVQFILDRKRSPIRCQNRFLFRLLLQCEHCKLYLVGERQKGHVYYRCHRKTCPRTCIREERLEAVLLEQLQTIGISANEQALVTKVLSDCKRTEHEIR